jgi:5-methylcytosine-specific restriction enzyme A
LLVETVPTNPPTFRPRGAPSRHEQKRAFDRSRRKDQPWRKWYSLRIWQNIRTAQLTSEPLCRRCKAQDLIVPATVVHHELPHHGDWQLFVSGPFESLCAPCHDREAQAEERAADRN